MSDAHPAVVPVELVEAVDDALATARAQLAMIRTRLAESAERLAMLDR